MRGSRSVMFGACVAIAVGCGGVQHAPASRVVSLRIRTHVGARYRRTTVMTRRCAAATTTTTDTEELVVRAVELGRITLGSRRVLHRESTDASAPLVPDTIVYRDYVVDEHGRQLASEGVDPDPMLSVTGGTLPERDVRIDDAWSSHVAVYPSEVGGVTQPGWQADITYRLVGFEPAAGDEVAVAFSRGTGGPDPGASDSTGDVRITLRDGMLRTERSRRHSSDGCVSTTESSTVEE